MALVSALAEKIFCGCHRPPIDPKRKKAAAELILFQQRSYREVSDLTGLSMSTLYRSVRALRDELTLAGKI